MSVKGMNRRQFVAAAACALSSLALGAGLAFADTATKSDTENEAEATDGKTAEAAADAKTTEEKAAALTDGTYTAKGTGIGGDVPVTVEIKDGKIAAVTVGENSETQGVGSKAIDQLPGKFVGLSTTKDVEAVDSVSGASVTSGALKSAVEDCLAQAVGGAKLADGKYEAKSAGKNGDIPVTVEVKDGKIVSVTVGENTETDGIGSKAIEELPAKFEGLSTSKDVDAVDGVSGATVTSDALKKAVDDCIKQAQDAAAMADKKTDDTTADDTKTDTAAASDKDPQATTDKTDETAAAGK